LAETRGKFWSTQHVKQFGQQYLAGTQLKHPGFCRIQQLTRWPRRNDARNQQIGVDDDAREVCASPFGLALKPGRLYLALNFIVGQGRQIQGVKPCHGIRQLLCAGGTLHTGGQELHKVHHFRHTLRWQALNFLHQDLGIDFRGLVRCQHQTLLEIRGTQNLARLNVKLHMVFYSTPISGEISL
jgi:hypothetical protein